MNPKMLQYVMGHSDISMTLNVYTHVTYDDIKGEMTRSGGNTLLIFLRFLLILKAKLCQFMQRYAKLMQENGVLKERNIIRKCLESP